jgi:prepilin-type processing-associated H-X9-DG protein
MKQVGLAFHMYHDGGGSFPPGKTTRWPRGQNTYTFDGSNGHGHGWGQYLLPFIEQDNLYKLYDWTQSWRNAANNPVNSKPVATYVCPMLGTDRQDRTAEGGSTTPRAVGDFVAISAAGDIMFTWLTNQGVTGYTAAQFPSAQRTGILDTDVWCRISDVTDGLSSTLLLAECADRPRRLRLGTEINKTVSGAGWASADNSSSPRGADPATGTRASSGSSPNGCFVNCSNEGEIYSYHPGVANVLLADGSGQSISRTITAQVLITLITRARGDLVDPSAF